MESSKNTKNKYTYFFTFYLKKKENNEIKDKGAFFISQFLIKNKSISELNLGIFLSNNNRKMKIKSQILVRKI